MATLAFASPILPGKVEAWLRFNQESLGSRLAQHTASRARLGVTRELIDDANRPCIICRLPPEGTHKGMPLQLYNLYLSYL
jgi:hypothetical protein